jgi:hypothetical protein
MKQTKLLEYNFPHMDPYYAIFVECKQYTGKLKRSRIVVKDKNLCIRDSKLLYVTITQPVTVAEMSKACTVFARSEAVIVGSNPIEGMDV